MKINKICCIGAGYVGGPTMAVIALKCPEIKVIVVDKNQKRVEAWNGPSNQLPVYEPGLSKIIEETRHKNLFFSTDIDNAIMESDMVFMAVNTPTKTEGAGAGMAADLKYIESCAKNIARVSKSDKIVVEKSTLPVRTAEKIKDILESNKHTGVSFEILSNPEFLAEGTAIKDLFKSDRVLIGGENSESGQKAIKALVDIYSNWIPKEKILTTNIWSSELSKLASNAMLAQRISSINSLSALCEKTGADVDEISMAIGMDHRIGPHFLRTSVGFGGSCFQKDILNLVYLCKYYGLNEVAEYWRQVLKINDYQKKRFAQKIIDGLGGKVNKKKIAILGWAFKAETNDSRESASIYVANDLILAGAEIHVYDPMVSKERVYIDLENLWKENLLDDKEILEKTSQVKIFDELVNTINGASAVGILTEWEEFKNYDWSIIDESIKIFDGRNITKNKRIQNIGKPYSWD